MIFAGLYAKMMQWAAHRHASRYLAALSFAESSFFPVPPDVMLIPMTITRPNCAIRFATITTVASVIGGLLGYLLGWWALDLIEPLLAKTGQWEAYQTIRTYFLTWGVWIVFVAGFSPIPYKLFTLSAGALSMALLPFVLASFIGRGARFFLVAVLVSYLQPRLGPRVGPLVRRYVEWLGWSSVVLLTAVVLWMWGRGG